MQFFAKTDQGKMRKMNQDFLFATKEGLGIFPNLFLLADGMGGHKAGDYASRYLVESLVSYIGEVKEESPIRCLDLGINRMNRELFCLSQNNGNLRGMGSTLVTAYVEEMIERGKMIRGSREYLSYKNYITRAVGVEEQLAVDYFEEELEEGDLFFLCSDGLSNMVDHESMVQVLKDDADLEEKGQALIDLANINGGKDNIALILVDPFGKE